MSRALFVVDVQNDFTVRGALGVVGGDEVAERISRFLGAHAGDYEIIVASRDWHDRDNDNGGHFAGGGTGADPDFVVTWPRHCVAGSPGAEYHPALDTSLIDVHVKKGQGRPAYSIFEGTTDEGAELIDLLDEKGVDAVHVVGIATDYCVLASARDALDAGRDVTVLTDLVAGVAPDSSAAALTELKAAGAHIQVAD